LICLEEDLWKKSWMGSIYWTWSWSVGKLLYMYLEEDIC
jgi:hypothetical protein